MSLGAVRRMVTTVKALITVPTPFGTTERRGRTYGNDLICFAPPWLSQHRSHALRRHTHYSDFQPVVLGSMRSIEGNDASAARCGRDFATFGMMGLLILPVPSSMQKNMFLFMLSGLCVPPCLRCCPNLLRDTFHSLLSEAFCVTPSFQSWRRAFA